MRLFLLNIEIIILFLTSTCEPSEVKVLLFDHEPYVIPGEYPKGSDVTILENFARKYKLTMKFIKTNVSITEIGDISDIDIIAGGLDGKKFSSDRFIESLSYHYDRMTWCMMKKAAYQPGYEIFYIVDDILVWILAIIVGVTMFCMAYFFQQFERHPKWDWNRIVVHGIGYSCSISGPYKPKTTAHRILFTVALFAGIIVDTLFIGFYLNKMQLQKKYDSFDEIYDGSYKLVGDPLAYQYVAKHNQVCKCFFFASVLNSLTFNQHFQTYHPNVLKEFQICFDLQSCFDKLEMNTDVALAISFEWTNGLTSGAFCFGQTHSIFEYELKFIVRKEFSFCEELNTFIGDALSSGLIGKWLRDHQKKHHFQIEDPFSCVKVDNFLGIWKMYLTMNTLIILLFIVEKIVHNRVRQSKTISWFWLFVENFISPDRCFLREDLNW